MGEVVQFRPATPYGKRLDAQARMERELQLPFTTMEPSATRRLRANMPDASPPEPTSKTRLPFNGIAIVVGTILVYALVISYVVGQPHYSARANFMPSFFAQE